LRELLVEAVIAEWRAAVIEGLTSGPYAARLTLRCTIGGQMPKIPVVDADPAVKVRKAFECELYAAKVVMALSRHDDESAGRVFAEAVERHGDEFLEQCRRHPNAKWRAMLARVAEIVAKTN
jgi:hypothetical protein